MNIFESIASSVSSVLANKMRSVLTMLGIIIGISSVIMITSIGNGFQATVSDQFAQLGMSGLQISLNYQKEYTDADMLRFSDLDVIKSHPLVTNAAPMWETTGNVYLRNPKESEMCYFSGSNEDYRYVQNMELLNGRYIMEADVTNRSYVAIIDESLSKKVFGRSNSIGEQIRVSFWGGTVELTVIGITKSQDYSEMFAIPPFIYMPVTTLMEVYNSDYVDYFYVSVSEQDKMDVVAKELTRLLGLKRGTTDMYRAQNLMQQMDTLNDVLSNITGFVVLVAAISLLVGGIGVMNIMLVTVTERTREIGIRKSLGAADGNILFQFLTEAMILTAIGGGIGIVLGYLGAFALGGLIDIVPKASVGTIVLTVLVSSAIGIVSGVYPAYKAARLDPIEALRYE